MAYGAESKDPGDACWQMLFRAFQPQTSSRINKVSTSGRKNIRSDVQKALVAEWTADPDRGLTSMAGKLGTVDTNAGLAAGADYVD
jgi:hypothetical protein